ncbi:hypothetical protein D3C78_1231180 [compost metagenome]
MAFYTKSEARAAASRVKGYRSASQVLSEAKSAQQTKQSFDVFLSHSINDQDLVLGVKTLLEGEGLTVYVDWIVDNQLERDRVNAETAAILRQRMRQSKSLIYVATSNASGSKWMPWELGFFDGHKPGNVAILPLVDSENQNFEGQEYLGLYPVVTRHLQNNGYKQTFVEERGRRWSHFKSFTSGSPIWSSY